MKINLTPNTGAYGWTGIHTGTAQERCEAGLNAFRSIIHRMGLKVNADKEEIGQTLTLLGVKLTTVAQGGDQCSAAMTDEKRAYVRERCDFFIQTDSASLKDIEKFVGLLAFCAHVSWGQDCTCARDTP